MTRACAFTSHGRQAGCPRVKRARRLCSSATSPLSARSIHVLLFACPSRALSLSWALSLCHTSRHIRLLTAPESASCDFYVAMQEEDVKQLFELQRKYFASFFQKLNFDEVRRCRLNTTA